MLVVVVVDVSVGAMPMDPPAVTRYVSGARDSVGMHMVSMWTVRMRVAGVPWPVRVRTVSHVVLMGPAMVIRSVVMSGQVLVKMNCHHRHRRCQ